MRSPEAAGVKTDVLAAALHEAAALLTALDGALPRGRGCASFGDELVVTTTCDDVAPTADTDPGEFVGVHERCRA